MNFLPPSLLSEIIAHTFRSGRLQDVGVIPQLATRLPASGASEKAQGTKTAGSSAEIYTQIVTCVIITTRRYLPPYRYKKE